MGTETERPKKCFTGALGKSRKSGDCKRMWHKQWELEYLEVTRMQYSAYRNDGSLDYQFFNSNKRPDVFSSALKGARIQSVWIAKSHTPIYDV